jgi:hypothetical protein
MNVYFFVQKAGDYRDNKRDERGYFENYRLISIKYFVASKKSSVIPLISRL